MAIKQVRISSEQVKLAVEQTLYECFPGYLDYDTRTRSQFVVVHLGEDLYLISDEGRPDLDPRGFRVVVHVVEQP